jgi:hypothetical protein
MNKPEEPSSQSKMPRYKIKDLYRVVTQDGRVVFYHALPENVLWTIIRNSLYLSESSSTLRIKYGKPLVDIDGVMQSMYFKRRLSNVKDFDKLFDWIEAIDCSTSVDYYQLVNREELTSIVNGVVEKLNAMSIEDHIEPQKVRKYGSKVK